ncbi:MAG TPA: hypothetical protein VMF88_07150 [Bacteroidota bacterium]|nr:hypothetical protein [Bacteroidota bacterium]
MSNSSHWTDDADVLDRYVLGRLEESERTLLDRHLSGCEQCSKQVEAEREFAAGIKLAGREKLREALRQSLKTDEANSFQRYQLIGLAAAVLVVLVGLGIFRFYSGGIEWPVKFSSKNYIIKQGPADSSAAAQGSAIRQSPQNENLGTESANGNQAPHAEESALPEGQSAGSFWLLGTVVMIPESGAHTPASAERSLPAKFSKQGEVFIIHQDGVSQTITLAQRTLHLLPHGQVNQSSAYKTVQTLVERTANGLSLTLYQEKLFRESQIRRATIEPVTEDSLIVDVEHEHIAYHIPGGWGAQPSTKTNFEHR